MYVYIGRGSPVLAGAAAFTSETVEPIELMRLSIDLTIGSAIMEKRARAQCIVNTRGPDFPVTQSIAPILAIRNCVLRIKRVMLAASPLKFSHLRVIFVCDAEYAT